MSHYQQYSIYGSNDIDWIVDLTSTLVEPLTHFPMQWLLIISTHIHVGLCAFLHFSKVSPANTPMLIDAGKSDS